MTKYHHKTPFYTSTSNQMRRIKAKDILNKKAIEKHFLSYIYLTDAFYSLGKTHKPLLNYDFTKYLNMKHQVLSEFHWKVVRLGL